MARIDHPSEPMTPLAEWQNFFVIVGSSAGALIGLQFVVMALIANGPVSSGSAQAGSAFATPTIVHFGVVLMLAGILTAPWHRMSFAEGVWGAVGAAGLIYIFGIARAMRTQTAYRPEAEDWLFHAVLPIVAYSTLAVSACLAVSYMRQMLFAVGAAVLLLLMVGIHNAWDAVTYHVFTRRLERSEKTKSSQ